MIQTYLLIIYEQNKCANGFREYTLKDLKTRATIPNVAKQSIDLQKLTVSTNLYIPHSCIM